MQKEDSFMITKTASEEFTNYNEFGYGIKVIQRSKNKFSKTFHHVKQLKRLKAHIDKQRH